MYRSSSIVNAVFPVFSWISWCAASLGSAIALVSVPFSQVQIAFACMKRKRSAFSHSIIGIARRESSFGNCAFNSASRTIGISAAFPIAPRISRSSFMKLKCCVPSIHCSPFIRSGASVEPAFNTASSRVSSFCASSARCRKRRARMSGKRSTCCLIMFRCIVDGEDAQADRKNDQCGSLKRGSFRNC